MATPTASTPGYGSFRGHVACDCLIEWLPVLERLAIAKGYVRESIDILQLTGTYQLSGGTHGQGGVFDLKQWSDGFVMLCREMGAPASWYRNMNFPDGSDGNDHTHGALSGCPHNDTTAEYQITAQRRGYNGMGKGTVAPYVGVWGYGGRDSHPAPSTYRTWAQGIAWAEAQIEELTMPTPAEIAAAVWAYPIKHPNPNGTTPTIPASASQWSANYYAWQAYEKALIASRATGDDVDEAALARELAPLLVPSIQAAMESGATTPEEVAAAVAKLFSVKLG